MLSVLQPDALASKKASPNAVIKPGQILTVSRDASNASSDSIGHLV
jgi:hypothetical protein